MIAGQPFVRRRDPMSAHKTIADNGKAFTYKVGDIGVTVVADGTRTAPLRDEYVGNASRAEVNAALAAASLPQEQTTTIFNPIVITTGGKNYLIDAGNGPDAIASSGGSCGHLLDSLGKAGLSAADIDVVVISHFHGDHVNGLFSQGAEVFPDAEITVPEIEWNFWMDDGEMARAAKGRMADLFKNNRRIFDPIKDKVTRYAWDKEIAPGVLAVGTSGHSIGHTSYIVSSGRRSVYVQSDLTNNEAIFVRNPQWNGAFDQDPDLAVATRLRVYDMLATEQMPMQGFHHPFPAHNYLERRAKGFRLVSAD
jgi:glyoxylase-like metal-dependent hydrolase (beta-lactamase superfamily II)